MYEPVAQLTIVTDSEEDVCIVRISGELDVATAPALLQELRRLLTTDARHVAIDVAELTYIDSMGVNLFASADSSFALAKRRLCLLRRHGVVQRIFELAHLADQVPSFDSLEEAREYLSQPVRRTRRVVHRRGLAL